MTGACNSKHIIRPNFMFGVRRSRSQAKRWCWYAPR